MFSYTSLVAPLLPLSFSLLHQFSLSQLLWLAPKGSPHFSLASIFLHFVEKMILLKVRSLGAENMAQWLRTLAALAEDIGSVPIPYTAANKSPQEGDPGPSSAL